MRFFEFESKEIVRQGGIPTSKGGFATSPDEARARGEQPPPLPEAVEHMLAGDSYVGACPGCRTISHVIGHHAGEREAP